MSRNQQIVPGGGRLQRSQTRCEADYRAALPRSGAYPAWLGSESSEAWMNLKGQMPWRESLLEVSSGRLLVNTVKKHGHIHSFMKGIQHLRDSPCRRP